jgi:hypothetical protein
MGNQSSTDAKSQTEEIGSVTKEHKISKDEQITQAQRFQEKKLSLEEELLKEDCSFNKSLIINAHVRCVNSNDKLFYAGILTSSNFRVNFKHKNNQSFIKMITWLSIPNHGGVNLMGSNLNGSIVKRFLENANLTDLTLFSVNWEEDWQKSIRSYLPSIQMFVQRSDSRISSLSNFDMNLKEFKRTVASFRHSSLVSLKKCILRLDKPFSFHNAMDDAKFKSLNLSHSESALFSDFGSNPHRLENLLKALGEVQTIRDNLFQLIIYNSGISDEKFKALLEDHKLINIKFD